MNKVVQTAVTIDYQGDTWVGEWIRYKTYLGADGTEAPNRYLVISKKAGEVFIPASDLYDLSNSDSYTIKGLITNKRIKDVQRQYGLPSSSISNNALALAVLKRAWQGDWMGQDCHNQEFSIVNLAAVLNSSYSATLRIVRKLQQQQKVEIVEDNILPKELT